MESIVDTMKKTRVISLMIKSPGMSFSNDFYSLRCSIKLSPIPKLLMHRSNPLTVTKLPDKKTRWITRENKRHSQYDIIELQRNVTIL